MARASYLRREGSAAAAISCEEGMRRERRSLQATLSLALSLVALLCHSCCCSWCNFNFFWCPCVVWSATASLSALCHSLSPVFLPLYFSPLSLSTLLGLPCASRSPMAALEPSQQVFYTHLSCSLSFSLSAIHLPRSSFVFSSSSSFNSTCWKATFCLIDHHTVETTNSVVVISTFHANASFSVCVCVIGCAEHSP